MARYPGNANVACGYLKIVFVPARPVVEPKELQWLFGLPLAQITNPIFLGIRDFHGCYAFKDDREALPFSVYEAECDPILLLANFPDRAAPKVLAWDIGDKAFRRNF